VKFLNLFSFQAKEEAAAETRETECDADSHGKPHRLQQHQLYQASGVD
jgi:hypothetical protein